MVLVFVSSNPTILWFYTQQRRPTLEARTNGKFGRVLLIAGDNRKDHNGFPLPEDERDLRRAELRRRRRAEALGRRSPPGGPDSALYCLGWLGMTMEEVVRDWLYERGFVLDPRQEIYYTHTDESGEELPALSRQIDAVLTDRRGRPNALVEVRLSVQGMGAVYRKMHQIRTTLEILQSQRQWRRLKPLIVYIAVGEQEDVQTAPDWLVDDDFEISPEWLRAYQHDELLPVGVPRIVIPLEWLWDYALGLGWELNPGLKREALQFAHRRRRLRAEREAERDRLWQIQDETEEGF